MRFFYWFFTKFYQITAKKMCRECRHFIKKGAKILDLGCGSAIVVNEFKNFFGAKISGADVIDKRVIPIDFTLYDGKNLPLADNSFDVVLLAYVLHHCQDPVRVLQETKRVASEKVIIYEDLPESFFSRILCKIHGKSFAFLFRDDKQSCNFKTTLEWKEVFSRLGLKLIFEKKVWPYSGRRMKMFVLEK